MYDIKWIRNNKKIFEKAMNRRKLFNITENIINIDKIRRKYIIKLQELETQRNTASKKISKAKIENNEIEFQSIIESITKIKNNIQKNKKIKCKFTEKLNNSLIQLPNILMDDVPDGFDENTNLEMYKIGTPTIFKFQPKNHYDLGKNLNQMNFKIAAKISGPRFVILSKDFARLERALANFMLNLHVNKYKREEIIVPLLVNKKALEGTGQLPKFEKDMFKTTNGKYLISTSEIPLTNLLSETLLQENELPKRYTSYSNCFRSEAGSAGKDTSGIIRQHQFTKVEIVSITHPDKSEKEQILMLHSAEEILKQLDLAYRVFKLCSGDTNFSSKRTFDIDVWFPAQNKYREVSSISTCGDFQARRLNTRFKTNKGKINFVHTLNGSGLAIGRTMAAIIENYQNKDGSINIPKVLQPYMDNKKLIKYFK